MALAGRKIPVCFLVLAMVSIQIFAQNHFTYTANTGNDMTVLVRTSINPNINGEPLENGDEIGAFNRNGLCAGAITWNQANAAITIWGDNDQTESVDGIAVNDTLYFHVWDKSQSTEMIATATFENETVLTYAANRIAKLQSLTIQYTGIPSYKPIVSKKNDLTTAMVTIFDMRGKKRLWLDGIAADREIVGRIKSSGLPYGKYLTVLQLKEGKVFKMISLTR